MAVLETIIGLTVAGVAFWLILKLKNFLINSDSKVVDTIVKVGGITAIAHNIRHAKRWLDKE